MPKKGWEDLSGTQKGAIVLSGVLQLGLLGGGARRYLPAAGRGDQGHQAPVALAAFINYVGPISYFLFGRKR